MKNCLLAIAGAIGAVMAIFFYGKRSGKVEEKTKNNERVIDNAEKAKKARDNANNSSLDHNLDELYNDAHE